jgi:Fur family ferric uptake transcriptional regulator
MEPLSAASLSRLLVGTRIHRATIFRTLALLEKKNIIRRVDFKEGEYRYELGTLPHHHHCICKSCGAIESIDICTISETKKQIKKRIGFQVIDHAFTLFGICKKCIALI